MIRFRLQFFPRLDNIVIFILPTLTFQKIVQLPGVLRPTLCMYIRDPPLLFLPGESVAFVLPVVVTVHHQEEVAYFQIQVHKFGLVEGGASVVRQEYQGYLCKEGESECEVEAQKGSQPGCILVFLYMLRI